MDKKMRLNNLFVFLGVIVLAWTILSGSRALEAGQITSAPTHALAENSRDGDTGVADAPREDKDADVAGAVFEKNPEDKPETLYVVDYARVLKESRPGKIVSRYVADYKNIVDGAYERLDNSSKIAQKRGNWVWYTSLRDDKNFLLSRKSRVDKKAKEYICRLVRNVLSVWPFYDNATVLDVSLVSPASARAYRDVTDSVIEQLRGVVPVMPDLPKVALVADKGRE